MAMVAAAFLPDAAAQWRSVMKAGVAKEAGVAGEARRLVRRLESAARASGDAERRAARGDEGARRWLATVRTAAYEAEDAVDRCRVEARRARGREQQALPRLLSSCCDTADHRLDVASAVKNLNKRMVAILKQQRQLQLQTDVGDAIPTRSVRRSKAQPLEPDVVGARNEADALRLVRWLTEKGRRGYVVVAVVGVDGIGKTTLAKKVYESPRVQRSFDTRAWVHVSSGYSEAGLLSRIVDAVGGDPARAQGAAELKAMLTGLIADKRFLLVLDDVWQGGLWEDLLRWPLEHGARGGVVLVTARHGSIAREMGAQYEHRVKKLSVQDGWLLLRKAVSLGEGNEIDGLKRVGEKIAEQCRRLPLGIKAVAGLLRTREVDAGEWMEVLRSPAWSVKGLPEDAMKALYLCYDDLSCHLKQCFLYCALLPPDFAIRRSDLVQQWIAEGFVQIRQDSAVEEAAEEYYEELIGRNLLQAESGHHDNGRCTMHDVLRSLAQLIMQCENMTGGTMLVPRHISLAGKGLAAVPEEVGRLEGLRTLLLPRNPLTIEADMLTRLHHLKVLDLSETAMEVVPDSLGNLVYLRFLNLSQTRIQAIPDSIGNLWSLKFLLLRECKSLHALPKGIEHLRGLRDLDLVGTVVNDTWFRVGQLRSLTSLQWFNATSTDERDKDRSGWLLDELKHLCQLRALHIRKLEKASDQSDAREAAVGGKTCLRELGLSCSGNVRPLQTPTAVRRIKEIFEELQPPQCLESLKIANYFGMKYPKWLSATFLPKLRRVELIGCSFCQSLPPLGQLPKLRFLHIADSSSLKQIDAEFMGTDHHHHVAFPELETLHIQGLHKLETWDDIEAGAMPSLQALQLESCPVLRRLPDGLGHVTSLTELRIVDAASLEAVEDLAALRELGVWNTPKLSKISNLPFLEDFNISRCPALRTVEKVDALRVVHVFDHNLQEMPGWIALYASRLRLLDVTGTVQLLKRCLPDGSDWPTVRDIAQVHGYTTGSSYICYSKSPYSFESNLSTQEESLHVEENVVDSDEDDNASREIRRADHDASVSAYGADFREISGFFDSKAMERGVVKKELSVLVVGTGLSRLMSRPRRSHRSLHKLAEVVPEDTDDEAGADSVVLFPIDSTTAPEVVDKVTPVVTDDHTENHDVSQPSGLIHGVSRAIGDNEIGHDSITSLVHTRRRRSKKGTDVSSDTYTASTNAYEMAQSTSGSKVKNKSGCAIGDTLIHNRSGTLSIAESNQNLGSNLDRSEQHASKKGDDVADHEAVKDDNDTPSPDTVTRRSLDMATGIFATAAYSKHDNEKAKDVSDATELSVPPPGATEIKKGEGISADFTAHEQARRALDTANKTSTDAVGKIISETAKPVQTESAKGLAVAMTGDHLEDLVHEEHRATRNDETSHDPNMVRVRRKTSKKGRADAAAANGDTDADTRRILDMASKITATVTKNSTATQCNELENKNAMNSPSNSMHAQSPAIDITEASKKAEATKVGGSSASKTIPGTLHGTANTFLADVKAKDGPTDDDDNDDYDARQGAPKVYTAIWADTDMDAEKARFFSAIRQYRRLASHRRQRRRRRRHASEEKWSFGPTIAMAILLLVSMVQLLLIFWLFQRLLNQK